MDKSKGLACASRLLRLKPVILAAGRARGTGRPPIPLRHPRRPATYETILAQPTAESSSIFRLIGR